MRAGSPGSTASLFRGGSGRCDIVKTIVSDDVVVIIQVERNEARVHGAAVPQSWILRTTQVFERRGDGWVRLHRHADPPHRPAPSGADLGHHPIRVLGHRTPVQLAPRSTPSRSRVVIRCSQATEQSRDSRRAQRRPKSSFVEQLV